MNTPTSKFNIPAVSARVTILGGEIELNEETVTYMNLVSKEVNACVEKLKNAPSTIDVGRLIAFLDAMQHAKNILSDAAILGSELHKRKMAAQESAEAKELPETTDDSSKTRSMKLKPRMKRL